MVDQRLRQLNLQRKQSRNRLDELEELENAQDQIAALTTEATKFLTTLEHVLREGLLQEKLAAIRQCTQKIRIDVTKRRIILTVYTAPIASLPSKTEVTVEV